MFFTKYENKVLKDYKNKIAADNSVKNILKVFTENYAEENKKYNRSEDADMLLFQYGVYDWGSGKNLEIDFARQLVKNDAIKQVHITLKFPYEEKFSKIESYEEWYNSSSSEKTVKEWHDEIEKQAIFEEINGMKYSLEIWIDSAE